MRVNHKETSAGNQRQATTKRRDEPLVLCRPPNKKHRRSGANAVAQADTEEDHGRTGLGGKQPLNVEVAKWFLCRIWECKKRKLRTTLAL